MTSPDGSWKMVTNSKGFRNTREFGIPKPAGVFRVLTIGDSHTQGYEVRQEFTYSAALERMLNRHGVRAEVINAGVSGFSTAEALVFLENEGIRYAPNVVVLGFFANDFEDNLKAGLFSLDDKNRLIEEKFEHLPGVHIQNALYSVAVIRWLSENSYFYSLLFNNVWIYFKLKLAKSAVDAADPKTPRRPDAASAFEYAVPSADTLSDFQIALTAALIDRMYQFCAERGIRLLILDIPKAGGPHRFETSMPKSLREKLPEQVEIIDSRVLFERYEGIAELHPPNGHKHISEFAHTLFGYEIGRRLLAPGGESAGK